ncbi:TRAP transporter permease [Nitrogeniibacter mangrovi]|uniref:TRAP transporter permease n=1 Tax=Nitrogeniibacter mangrovi TaxID=2016596 RepID=A0A6C1B0W4_9RHOO|nr:TRAP transporter permease [Nitrogeniibacter mangrovi]QID16545.1 TRAP transporter permease [Nitrogeniibacter mangrovi]
MDAHARSKTEALEEMVAEIESGSRHPAGPVGLFLSALALLWSLFQLYVASGVPFWLSETVGLNVVFNNQEVRQVHLAFAMALCALAYPLFKGSPHDRIPWYDWLLAAVGVGCCLYLLIFKNDIADRAGLPTVADMTISALGLISLGIAVLRSLGLPLLLVATVFLCYVFFGDLPWLPEVVQWKGASFGKAMWHFWMQTEGVFGVALGVSATMIFLFVLFGALLERAGAGNYFIQLALSLLGHLRGGPAKAAVVASGLSGLYSGSSIANVVTTGTFTIPLMVKTGFTREKAGAVEVASSTNGQLTPPVMGAAAFLIAEFTGEAYTDVIRHAVVPALASYIALFYIVHLEAMKLGLEGMPRPSARFTAMQKLMGFLGGFVAMGVLGVLVYYVLGAVARALPGMTPWAGAFIFLLAYLVLVRIAAARPDLEHKEPEHFDVLPRVDEVAPTGLYYVLPILVLLWCILVDRLSPALSAFWASLAMLFVVLTQDFLKALFRREHAHLGHFREGVVGMVEGMIAGARNMVPIGVATGVAGVVIGTVSLTGAHQVVGEFVEMLAGGNVMVMLLLVAVMSLILGMGLPTTANYIVVSSLMAPVIVSVGAQTGLVVPLIAVHMFVFYFGILADDTPPVGVAAFAAAAISGGDPIRTGLQGFGYDIRTALLPFLFIFNTELLLIDVTPLHAVFVFVIAVVAMLLFAAATQGYFITRSRGWESAALLLVAFTLFRPGFWLDQVEDPFVHLPGASVAKVAAALPEGDFLRMVVSGPDFDKPDRQVALTLVVPMGAPGAGAARLQAAGLVLGDNPDAPTGTVALDEPLAGTPYFAKLQGFDFYADTPVVIERVEQDAERLPKEVFYAPALVLLAFIVLRQRARRRREAAA